jgi:hypothetical protein
MIIVSYSILSDFLFEINRNFASHSYIVHSSAILRALLKAHYASEINKFVLL